LHADLAKALFENEAYLVLPAAPEIPKETREREFSQKIRNKLKPYNCSSVIPNMSMFVRVAE
jgi:hypothetical protein